MATDKSGKCSKRSRRGSRTDYHIRRQYERKARRVARSSGPVALDRYVEWVQKTQSIGAITAVRQVVGAEKARHTQRLRKRERKSA